jgi:DNA-binding transcriptional ArsR family regulator/copper chaperone CopZ
VLDRCDITVVHPRTVAAAGEPHRARRAQRVADVFKVLGDPSRCRLVYALLAAGEICVCDLAAALGMSESNVSHHLRVLRAHGLVRPRRQGKMVYYAPDDEHISLLLDLTREHVTHASGSGDRRGRRPRRPREPGPRGGAVTTKQLDLPVLLPRGAECEECVLELSQALTGVPGVEDISSDVTRGRLHVGFDPAVVSYDDLVRQARRVATRAHCPAHCPDGVHEHGELDLSLALPESAAEVERRLAHVTGLDCAETAPSSSRARCARCPA